MTTAVIGLGSSLGDRRRHLQLATRLLHSSPNISPLRGSRLWVTQPVGGVAKGWFLNAAICVETTFSVQQLLGYCKWVEVRTGRQAAVRWADRVVDLDILMFGEDHIVEAGLVVPHPRMLERNFALGPAQEVAGEMRHPIEGVSLQQLPCMRRGMWPIGVLSVSALAR